MLRFNNEDHAGDQRLPLITSRNNPIVKTIRGLASRKERERTGQCFVEGLHLVASAVQQGATIDTCVVAPDLLSAFGRDLARAIVDRGARRVEVTAEVFHSLAAKDRPQGLGIVVNQCWESLARFDASTGRRWVALDTVQYPANLGTILRTCDAVGGAGVILLGDTADPYDPAAVRASVGAIFAQRLARASFAEFIEWKRHNRAMVVGTSPIATQDYRSVAYQPPVVLLMGSEARGLTREQQDMCDVVVTIPMVGQSDSLNLAVAASVVLYEIFHQHQL
jgi:RNA methyltransferase, TrmH family